MFAPHQAALPAALAALLLQPQKHEHFTSVCTSGEKYVYILRCAGEANTAAAFRQNVQAVHQHLHEILKCMYTS
jgi:hypothetical protein